jgi:hypothetical protein
MTLLSTMCLSLLPHPPTPTRLPPPMSPTISRSTMIRHLRLHLPHLPTSPVLLLPRLTLGLNLLSPGTILPLCLHPPLHPPLPHHLLSNNAQRTSPHHGPMLHVLPPTNNIASSLKLLRLSSHPIPMVLPAFRQYVPLHQHQLWSLLPLTLSLAPTLHFLQMAA